MPQQTIGEQPLPIAWLHRLLRTPLLTKLVVLDLGINVATFLVLQRMPPGYAEEITLSSLLTMLCLNAGLVAWALRPLKVLEDTARRVSNGEFTARTSMPLLADPNLVRIGNTLDGLLDRVGAERERVRSLAAQVIAVGDQERARIARELHDGTAQSLSALDMLLSTALAEHEGEAVDGKLEVMREIVSEALSEVRTLCHLVHPRVLEDLGLCAALESLARRTSEQSNVSIHTDCPPAVVPKPLASVLYRVAQEALHNAVKHANATQIRITLRVTDSEAALEVSDDGVGFERAEIEAQRRGMGLFVMEERVALVDGKLTITSRNAGGTMVRTTLPLRREAA